MAPRRLAALLPLLAALAAADPTYCSDASTCGACAGAVSKYDGPCGWCDSYGSCQSVSSSYCGGRSLTTNAGSCPVPLTVEAAAWSSADAMGTLALGALATAATAVMAFSPIERACGRRAATTPAPGTEPSAATIGFTFTGSALLWTALSLLLAAPAAPWITSVRGTAGYYYATAFTINTCSKFSPDSSTYACQTIPLAVYADGDSELGSKLLTKVNEGTTLGAFSLVFAIGLLFPAALMSSLATYRLSMLARHGEAPYSTGCSPANLAVAQTLAWAGAGLMSLILLLALALCKTLVDNELKSLTPTYMNSPGAVLLGLAVGAALAGAALLNAAARAAKEITGVGCNGGGCCCARGAEAAAPLLGAERYAAH